VVFRQRQLYELFRQCYVMIMAKRHLSDCGMATWMRHAQYASILRRRYGKKSILFEMVKILFYVKPYASKDARTVYIGCFPVRD
jgi:hypothetical protein